MRKLFVAFLLVSCVFCIQSCTAPKTVNVKSPCVSTDDGPCGPRKSVNANWMV